MLLHIFHYLCPPVFDFSSTRPILFYMSSNAEIVVKRVSSDKEMSRFISFPNELYRDNSCFVPFLRSDDLSTFDRNKNGAFEFCEAELFLAFRGGKVVGRVAAIINTRANSIWNTRQVRFGWLDFVDDIDVLKALVSAVSEWGAERGMDTMAGPLGFTDFDPEGMLVDGFDRMGTMITMYNHPYYSEHLESLGFEKDADWVEYLIKLPEELPERFFKMSELVKEKFNLRVRHLTRRDIRREKYGRKLFGLINEAYAHLYGYSALSKRQIDQYVSQYLGFIDLRMISFVEDSNGELVACGITVPSLSEALRKCNGKLFPFGWFHLLNALYFNRSEVLDLLLVAVKPEYQSKGLNAVIFVDIIPRLIKMGFKYAESNPELETNKKVQSLWSVFENEIHKRRRVYARKIE